MDLQKSLMDFKDRMIMRQRILTRVISDKVEADRSGRSEVESYRPKGDSHEVMYISPDNKKTTFIKASHVYEIKAMEKQGWKRYIPAKPNGQI